MNLEVKNIVIDGLNFQTRPIPPLLALRLDKKIVYLVLPIFKNIKSLDVDATLDIGAITETLSKSLESLGDEEFENFIVNMFSTTVCTPEGGAPLGLNEKKNIDIVFVGRLFSVYKLLWELMSYNKFSPFVIAGGGMGTLGTLFSKAVMPEVKGDGNKLETSES